MTSFCVIIPCYNRRELVVRAVASVTQTNASNTSVIVVDDGSTDGTASQLQQRFSHRELTVLVQDHAGATAARNRGGFAANSDWLIFLDSDDELTVDTFDIFANTVHSVTNAGVVCAGADLVHDDGTHKQTRLPRPLGGSYNDHTGLFLAGTFAVRREIFQALGGFSTECRANQHKEFALRLIPYCDEHGFGVAHTDQVTVHVHEHAGEHLRSNMENLLEGCLYILEHHKQQIIKSPSHFADWCSITGVYAAKLGRWDVARKLFYQSIAGSPARPMDLARLGACLVPYLRTRLWTQN